MNNISAIDKMIDPVWDYAIVAKLNPYIHAIRDFWKHATELDISNVGVFNIQGSNIPPGLMYRVTATPVRSPIKNIQVFPFIPVPFLQMAAIPGGISKMITRVCANERLTIDEFTIIEKSNLPSTYHKGQIIAVIPTELLHQKKLQGKYIYFTLDEMFAISKDFVPNSVKQKVQKYL